jgi:hypothetical protein
VGTSTVKDEANGLEWQRTDDGIKRTWRDSLDACAHLSLAGHADWHLPNSFELLSLLEYGASENVKIDPAFDKARPELYWSSTPSENTPGLAWTVGFNLGTVDAVSDNGRAFARCVRHFQVSAPSCRCGPAESSGALAWLALALLGLRSRSRVRDP